ncbi:MAG: thioredoxin family protein [Planctomycetales bacterium]|nr:thioredoxin family protein [Planctomycetales bacterium]
MKRLMLVALALMLSQDFGRAAEQAIDVQGVAAPASAIMPVASRRPLFRHRDVNQAWSATQSSRRPMFLYFTSDSCRYCKKMVQQTLSHPQIASELAAYAEPVEINASKTPELARKLGVRAYPTTLVISPENQVLFRAEGYMEPRAFVDRMWPVLRQSEAARHGANTTQR